MKYNFAIVLLLCSLLVGCGGGSEVPTVRIEGRVTYGGGDWPSAAMLYFVSLESADGLPSRPVASLLQSDGTFTVTSFSKGDGLVPGRYAVIIESWKTAPTMSAPKGESYVPEDYHNAKASPIRLDIKPGDSTVTINHDVPAE